MRLRNITLSLLALFAMLVVGLTACNPASPQASSALQLEEHALTGMPEVETGAFKPLEGSADEILAVHAAERAKFYEKVVTDHQGNPALSPLGEGSNLVAVLTTSETNPPEQSVVLSLGDTPIFTASAGLPSPLLPLQGLWAYEGHWALEILYADESAWAGQIFIDGELLNEREGYDEAFGFQLLMGKPFYFFQRDGNLGYSYDGLETDLDYDQIPHYRCCGETALNPVQSQNMVAFFAQRGEDWYYVEIGEFSSG